MAAGGQWTVVFDDKCIIKNNGAEAGTGYAIDDDAFWSQSKFSNIWAIQFGTANPSDTVEYRDETPHSTYEDANLGDFNEFVTRWDAAHLARLQSDWDESNKTQYNPVTIKDENGVPVPAETEAEKIARLGERPTEYSSS